MAKKAFSCHQLDKTNIKFLRQKLTTCNKAEKEICDHIDAHKAQNAHRGTENIQVVQRQFGKRSRPNLNKKNNNFGLEIFEV